MSAETNLSATADTVLPLAEDQRVNAIWQTLNTVDRLDGGGGIDTLALTGGGTFNLGTLSQFVGFEQLTLTNETSLAAALIPQPGTDLEVTLGNGASGRTTASDGGPLINVTLSTGKNVIRGGAENNTFNAYGSGALKAGDVIDGGGGYDILGLGTTYGGKFAQTHLYDLTRVDLSGIEEINFIPGQWGATSSAIIDQAVVSGLTKIQGNFSSQTNLQTAEREIDLGALQLQAVALRSSSLEGTTFRAHNLEQVQALRGGSGIDTLISDVALTYGQRNTRLAGYEFERVIDPTGSYRKLITVDSVVLAGNAVQQEGFSGSEPRDYSLTDNSLVTIAGSVDATAVGPVIIYADVGDINGRNNKIEVGRAAIGADGTWSLDVTLEEEKIYSFSATVTDGAGNEDRGSNEKRYVVDETPPVVSILTQDYDDNHRYVSLSGSAVTQTSSGVDAGGEAGAEVGIYSGDVLLGTTRIDANGNWSLGVTLPSYGAYSLVAKASDRIGNVGSSNAVEVDIEAVRGPGGGVVTDAADPAYQVYRLYEAVLGREPDAIGLSNWLQILNNGQNTLVGVAAGFTNSSEFQATYGSLSNGDFVTLLYENVLDRAPDSGGLTGWTQQLNAGTSREAVVLGFSESVEFRNQIGMETPDGIWVQDPEDASVARLYYATLDRAPDLAGLSGWADVLENGTPLVQVAAGFTRSSEFQSQYGTLDNSAFVDLLYQNVLEREADAQGKAGWLSVLAESSRENVVVGFSESAEFQYKIQPNLDYGFLLA